MRNDFYVYSHLRPSNGEAFYIGKGTGVRCKTGAGRNDDWHKIVDEEGGFLFKILISNLTEDQAYKYERDFLNQIGYKNLVNRQGGKGGCSVVVDGKEYDSIREAERKTGISRYKLNRSKGKTTDSSEMSKDNRGGWAKTRTRWKN